METIKSNSNSKTKAIIAVLGIISALFFIVSIIVHLTPLGMLEYIEDFAVHHYFLMSFISLVVLLVSAKFYSTLNENIDRNYRETNSPELSKNRRKRQKLVDLFINKKQRADENNSCFIKIKEVTNLSFSKDDVLTNEEARKQRQKDIEKATTLGNSYKQKVIVLFKTNDVKKHLITTVWQNTTDHISLKGGIVLPIKSIYKIEF